MILYRYPNTGKKTQRNWMCMNDKTMGTFEQRFFKMGIMLQFIHCDMFELQ